MSNLRNFRTNLRRHARRVVATAMSSRKFRKRRQRLLLTMGGPFFRRNYKLRRFNRRKNAAFAVHTLRLGLYYYLQKNLLRRLPISLGVAHWKVKFKKALTDTLSRYAIRSASRFGNLLTNTRRNPKSRYKQRRIPGFLIFLNPLYYKFRASRSPLMRTWRFIMQKNLLLRSKYNFKRFAKVSTRRRVLRPLSFEFFVRRQLKLTFIRYRLRGVRKPRPLYYGLYGLCFQRLFRHAINSTARPAFARIMKVRRQRRRIRACRKRLLLKKNMKPLVSRSVTALKSAVLLRSNFRRPLSTVKYSIGEYASPSRQDNTTLPPFTFANAPVLRVSRFLIFNACLRRRIRATAAATARGRKKFSKVHRYSTFNMFFKLKTYKSWTVRFVHKNFLPNTALPFRQVHYTKRLILKKKRSRKFSIGLQYHLSRRLKPYSFLSPIPVIPNPQLPQAKHQFGVVFVALKHYFSLKNLVIMTTPYSSNPFNLKTTTKYIKRFVRRQNFFLFQFKKYLYYIVMGWMTRNINLVLHYFTFLFNNYHFKRHRRMISSFRFIFLKLYRHMPVGKSVSIVLRGKIGLGGSVRKRKYEFYYGQFLGHANTKKKVVVGTRQIWTHTGVLGVRAKIS